MTDTRYLNREIDEKFDFIKEMLERIEAQTTKTNGRVTTNEKEILKIKTGIAVGRWMGAAMWTLAIAVLSFFK